jgi:hypothetical protein
MLHQHRNGEAVEICRAIVKHVFAVDQRQRNEVELVIV